MFHRNFGQLGFALKDSRTPNFQEAKEALSKAISIRGKSAEGQEPVWIFYDYVRAQCRILLDPNFTRDIPSTAQEREKIEADVRVALGLGVIVRDDALIRRWASLNKVQL
ncbi:MAG: hypothetical protein ABW061_06155 [Polyangiaceae bacterium]